MRLKKLANVHAQLLNHALKSYPNLKRLVYSTCSANHEENEAVVDEALSVNGKFKLLDCTKMVKGWTNRGVPGYDCSEMCLNAVPSDDCTNGFFIAVFVRRDLDENEAAEEEKNIADDVFVVKKENIADDVVVKKENIVDDEEENIKGNKEEKVIEDNEILEQEKVIENTKIVKNKNKKANKSITINTDKNEESKPQVKKENIESIPLVKSKNAKRRERRLKLEQSKGITNHQKVKKQKKMKNVKTEET
uniref:Putative methyltransferase NSUN5 n=1 Tax=Schizaphis graminum TaxID=13262 RepID=A0A2S2PFJ5_SCHGA